MRVWRAEQAAKLAEKRARMPVVLEDEVQVQVEGDGGVDMVRPQGGKEQQKKRGKREKVRGWVRKVRF